MVTGYLINATIIKRGIERHITVRVACERLAPVLRAIATRYPGWQVFETF